MLVLSRRAGESIRINDDIVVSVQRVAGNRIVIGIEAPQEVSIRRGELVIADEAAEEAPAAESRPAPSAARTNRVRNEGGANAKSAARPGNRRGLGIAPLGSHVSGWSTAHLS